MRCKCGFNSFDHNLVCPKCHKDLTATHRLLNLEIPAPGGVDFFQIVGQKMAFDVELPPVEIEVTPLDPMPTHQADAPDGDEGDDLTALVTGVDLDVLEGEL